MAEKKPRNQGYVKDSTHGTERTFNLNTEDNSIVDDMKEAVLPKDVQAEMEVQRNRHKRLQGK